MRLSDKIRLEIHDKVPHHTPLTYRDISRIIDEGRNERYQRGDSRVLATLRYMQNIGEAQRINPRYRSNWIILDETNLQPLKTGVFDA